MRARKIWSEYAKISCVEIDLCVESLVPSACLSIEGFDWLIGNHSDELTPWIPVDS